MLSLGENVRKQCSIYFSLYVHNASQGADELLKDVFDSFTFKRNFLRSERLKKGQIKIFCYILAILTQTI